MNFIQIEFNYVKFIFLFFLVSNNSFSDNSLDSLYNILNQEMINSVEYDKKKELRITNLILELENSKSTKDQYEKRKKLIDEYQYYDLNKTFENIEINFNLSKNLNNQNLQTQTLLKFTQLLISSGRYKESIDILNDINHTDIDESIEKLYYTNYTNGYSRLTYNTVANESKKQYVELYDTYKDTLVTFLDRNSDEYLRIKEKSYLSHGPMVKWLTHSVLLKRLNYRNC